MGSVRETLRSGRLSRRNLILNATQMSRRAQAARIDEPIVNHRTRVAR
jgi:hypothetical protein